METIMNKVKWLSRDLLRGLDKVVLQEKMPLEETVNSLGDYINKYINSNKALSIKDITNNYIKLKQYLFIRAEREKSIRNFEIVYKRIQELKEEEVYNIDALAKLRNEINIDDIKDYQFSYSNKDIVIYRNNEALPILHLDKDEFTLNDYIINLKLMESLFFNIYDNNHKTYKEFIKDNPSYFNATLPMCFIVLNLSRIHYAANTEDSKFLKSISDILDSYNKSENKYILCNYHK